MQQQVCDITFNSRAGRVSCWYQMSIYIDNIWLLAHDSCHVRSQFNKHLMAKHDVFDSAAWVVAQSNRGCVGYELFRMAAGCLDLCTKESTSFVPAKSLFNSVFPRVQLHIDHRDNTDPSTTSINVHHLALFTYETFWHFPLFDTSRWNYAWIKDVHASNVRIFSSCQAVNGRSVHSL